MAVSSETQCCKKLNGELAEGEADQFLQRWQQHFATLLNVQSSVDEEVLDAMPIHANPVLRV